MFCYLTTEFNKIQNRLGIGGIKELIHFVCVWSSDEISFYNETNSYHLQKKDIQINNEIRPPVIEDCKDYKTSYSAEYLSICQPQLVSDAILAHRNLQSTL